MRLVRAAAARQDDRRGGIQEFLAVVLADAEDIQPNLVG